MLYEVVENLVFEQEQRLVLIFLIILGERGFELKMPSLLPISLEGLGGFRLVSNFNLMSWMDVDNLKKYHFRFIHYWGVTSAIIDHWLQLWLNW